MDEDYQAFQFTRTFLVAWASASLTPRDRELVVKALDLLAANERHPSLRVHQLRGDLAGLWSASASRQIRLIFERLPDGRKRLWDVNRHYRD